MADYRFYWAQSLLFFPFLPLGSFFQLSLAGVVMVFFFFGGAVKYFLFRAMGVFLSYLVRVQIIDRPVFG